MLRLVTALTLLASSNNKGLKAISFDYAANKHTLSILTRISINSSGTLVADPTSPDVILQLEEGLISAFGVGIEPGNVTVVPLWGTQERREARVCAMGMYDGQYALLQEDEVEDVRRSLSSSGGAQQGTFGAQDPVPQLQWSNERGPRRRCPGKLLEHDQGLSVLDSNNNALQTVARDDEGRWSLKRTTGIAVKGYNTSADEALSYRNMLHLLEPGNGRLTYHYFGEQGIPPQHIFLNTSLPSASPIQHAKLLLSSRSEHFPRSYIYAARGNTIFTIATPNDPADAPRVVARITTTLTSITSAMLVSDEGRYMVLGGDGGLRVYQRVLGGAGMVEVARMRLEDRVDSLLWL
ncbi:hypothetical protein BDV93DRAFT_558513 [Ceratobasidium sp. AG-I]|nr:hypothetical protein BDV93DRAFT_558513 [Ceratobasidium sp. AG-I]